VTRPLDLGLYLVTDTTLCGERGVVETVRAALPGGVTAVQVRAPSATTRELCALTLAVHDVLAGTGVPLLVNDRLDVALALGAEGVHLGQGDLAPGHARRLGGRDLLIGLSVSTLEEVAQAAALPPGYLDYLGVGPVHATATKPEAAAPLGLSGTAELVAASPLPCVAIGGVGVENAAAVRATGVAGVAVVSAICAAAAPAAAAAALLAEGATRP
jgi:thiamine-phosphate pyrophosphorylase